MFLWLLTFYQTGPNGLFIFYQVFNLILQSADEIYLVLDQLGEEVKDDFTVIIGGKDEVPFDVLELKD